MIFSDRAPYPTHFPLAWTRSSLAEEQMLMTKLDELYTKISENELCPSPAESISEINQPVEALNSTQSKLPEEMEVPLNNNEIPNELIKPLSDKTTGSSASNLTYEENSSLNNVTKKNTEVSNPDIALIHESPKLNGSESESKLEENNLISEESAQTEDSSLDSKSSQLTTEIKSPEENTEVQIKSMEPTPKESINDNLLTSSTEDSSSINDTEEENKTEEFISDASLNSISSKSVLDTSAKSEELVLDESIDDPNVNTKIPTNNSLIENLDNDFDQTSEFDPFSIQCDKSKNVDQTQSLTSEAVLSTVKNDNSFINESNDVANTLNNEFMSNAEEIKSNGNITNENNNQINSSPLTKEQEPNSQVIENLLELPSEQITNPSPVNTSEVKYDNENSLI